MVLANENLFEHTSFSLCIYYNLDITVNSGLVEDVGHFKKYDKNNKKYENEEKVLLCPPLNKQ